MPLAGTAPVLAALMKTKMDSLAPPAQGQPIDDAYRLAMFQKLAEAVIEHIIANAVVTGPVTVASVSGVTVGAGVSGPGTGTLTAGVIG